MYYHIYTTPGIVLKRTPFGEANMLVHLLTRDLGLIMASVQGVRQATSKLNPSLQEFSLSTVSCIKGKRGWKVTDARTDTNFYFPSEKSAQALITRVGSVLMQMIPGEEAQPQIFDLVTSGWKFLPDVSENDIKNFECLIMLRILFQLGYVVKNADTETFLSDAVEWNADLLAQVGEERPKIVSFINKGLAESHLT